MNGMCLCALPSLFRVPSTSRLPQHYTPPLPPARSLTSFREHPCLIFAHTIFQQTQFSNPDHDHDLLPAFLCTLLLRTLLLLLQPDYYAQSQNDRAREKAPLRSRKRAATDRHFYHRADTYANSGFPISTLFTIALHWFATLTFVA